MRLEYSALHLSFVHRAARMPSLDRSFNCFRVAGTSGRLEFSLSLGTSGNRASSPCKIWCGFGVPRLVKESVAPKRRSSAGWMLKRIGR